MQILATMGLTFSAAALGSLLYLIGRQRPQHRPFGRRGWRYTLAATGWLAAVTTLGTYLVTLLGTHAVASPLLAFAAPLGAGGVQAVSQRTRGGDLGLDESGESGPLPQWLTLGLPMVLDWLDQHLADLKQRQIDAWHAGLRGDRALRRLIKRFHARLAERRLPGTPALMHRLDLHADRYAELHDQIRDADSTGRRRLHAELAVVVDDILRLVYEARADALLERAAVTRPGDTPCAARPRRVVSAEISSVKRAARRRLRRRAAST